ncbi:MAG TPA: SDR family NAD(P)-dependent oxidoreductase, partial [Alteraurantiacibacter sp.]
MSERFDGQPILISGAGRGLGEGIARQLASEGAVIGVADIDEANAHDVAASIQAAGGRAHAYGGDLGRRQVFFDVAAAFRRDAGPLRAVINNASVLVYEP